MDYPVLLDTFQRPNGAPGTADSGHIWNPSGANLPSIMNHELTTPGGGPGGYAFVDVMRHPLYQYADVRWSNLTNACVLISSRRGNNLDFMSHIYFDATSYLVQYRDEFVGSPTIITSGTYPTPAVAGPTYRIGVTFNGNCLTLQFPDGTIRKVCSDLLGKVTGRYLCYQTAGSGIFIKKAGCTLQGRGLV